MGIVPKIELIYNRTGKLNKRGGALVQIKLYQYDPQTLRAKRKYISTGVNIKPDQWEGGRVKNHPNAIKLNIQIGEKLNKVQKFIDEEGENFTLDKLEQFLKGNYQHSLNGFIKFNLQNLSDTKQRQHLTMLEHLTKYAGEVQFKDVNQDFIEGFDRYLKQ